MGLIKTFLIVLIIFLTGCATTRKEMFQGKPIELEAGQELVINRHQHNLDIWLKSEKRFVGVSAFKNTGPCPDPSGH